MANHRNRVHGRWELLDLICVNGQRYAPFAECACEWTFRAINGLAEKAAVIVTTNLLFTEWSQVMITQRP